MRCNECGGNLPYGAYGHIRCEFCNTPNYVPVPGERMEYGEREEARKEQEVEKKGSLNLIKKIFNLIRFGFAYDNILVKLYTLSYSGWILFMVFLYFAAINDLFLREIDIGLFIFIIIMVSISIQFAVMPLYFLEKKRQ